ncbi:MAG: hypothetical protein Q9174_003414 [Haloplaca sp. 1 TL-2023]
MRRPWVRMLKRKAGTTYLDHAGTTLYSRSLITEYRNTLDQNLFGNPHSQSPSSKLSTDSVETARSRMLAFFRADPEHFDLVFVANATAAIKVVADGFRGSTSDHGFWYGYHADAHTSLVGLRELAPAGSRCFSSDNEVEEWINQGVLSGTLSKSTCRSLGLFAFPAQSNMNGRRLPLTWPGRLRRSAAKDGQGMYSLLDAAAFVSTAQLDLSDHANAPDFTALSFYKIFGFPDLGALIVRKDAGHILLKRPYFGGGTVDMVINDKEDPWHATKQGSLHEALEDGTPAFHSIAALHCALDVHIKLYGSMDNVSQHAARLAAALYRRLSSLSHANGTPVCTIYKGHNADYEVRQTQGPTLAFNLRTSRGAWIGKSRFERLAILNGIQLRTGGVCNPGGIAQHLDLSAKEMRLNYAEGLRCGNGFDELNGKPTGIVRVSFGAMSSMKDVDAFMNFISLFVDKGSRSPANLSRPGLISSHSFDPATLMRKRSELSSDHECQADCQEDKIAEVQRLENDGRKKSYVIHVSTPKPQCPIARCSMIFLNEEQLWSHFETHRARRRGFWAFLRGLMGPGRSSKTKVNGTHRSGPKKS